MHGFKGPFILYVAVLLKIFEINLFENELMQENLT